MSNIKKRLPGLAIELASLLVITSAFVVEMAHIATTAWLQMFLYNGDSLTLPVIYRSLQLHEPIKWVFSSQLNLFPEAIPFAASLPFGPSTRTVLFMNAFFNVIIFYALIRLLLRVATNADLHQRRLFGLLTMLVLFLCMLMELPTAYGQTMLTYLLFSTYYTGPLFIGMLSLCFLAWQIKQPTFDWRKHRWLISCMIIITSLTIASNPLYILMFSVPFLGTIAALWSLRAIKHLRINPLAWQQIIPIIIGLLLRHLFLKSFIGQPSTSHLSSLGGFLNWKVSFDFVIKSIAPIFASAGTRLRIFITLGLYFGCLFTLLLILRRRQRTKSLQLKPARLFALLFLVIEPIILIAGLYNGNGTPERYLIGSYALMLLAIPLIADAKIGRRLARPLAYAAVCLSAVTLVLGVDKVSALQPFHSGYNVDQQCLAQSLNFRPANGLADFWTARPLDIYNTYQERVLQLMGGEVYPWLNNLASYDGKNFTFYVQQRNLSFTQYFETRNDAPPPHFASVSTCDHFLVYHYPPGSPGYDQLNQKIHKSLTKAERARQSGKISDLLSQWMMSGF